MILTNWYSLKYTVVSITSNVQSPQSYCQSTYCLSIRCLPYGLINLNCFIAVGYAHMSVNSAGHGRETHVYIIYSAWLHSLVTRQHRFDTLHKASITSEHLSSSRHSFRQGYGEVTSNACKAVIENNNRVCVVT